MTENIVTGKKFRILTDATNKIYDRISFWTKASDVEFNDGGTAESKLGSISGVTDSLTSTSSSIAASAAAVKGLNDKITELSTSLNGRFTKWDFASKLNSTNGCSIAYSGPTKLQNTTLYASTTYSDSVYPAKAQVISTNGIIKLYTANSENQRCAVIFKDKLDTKDIDMIVAEFSITPATSGDNAGKLHTALGLRTDCTSINTSSRPWFGAVSGIRYVDCADGDGENSNASWTNRSYIALDVSDLTSSYYLVFGYFQPSSGKTVYVSLKNLYTISMN